MRRVDPTTSGDGSYPRPARCQPRCRAGALMSLPAHWHPLCDCALWVLERWDGQWGLETTGVSECAAYTWQARECANFGQCFAKRRRVRFPPEGRDVSQIALQIT